VLDRPRLSRSQFVFTQAKDREAISWQTQKTARAGNPGGRIPRRCTYRTGQDRRRYPRALPTASRIRVRRRPGTPSPGATTRSHAPDGSILATVERKSLDDLATALSNGTLALQLQPFCELPLAAVVIEARYSAAYRLEHVDGGWLADQLTRLQARYPEVPPVFADSRRYAEDWTYRFLTTALADTADPSSTN
jgi:hypothetical protein